MPSLKWSLTKSVQAYSSISKKYHLCLQEKFEILNYPNPNELLNKSLFQSAATLTSFYCQILNLTIRPHEKCLIRNI